MENYILKTPDEICRAIAELDIAREREYQADLERMNRRRDYTPLEREFHLGVTYEVGTPSHFPNG